MQHQGLSSSALLCFFSVCAIGCSSAAAPAAPPGDGGDVTQEPNPGDDGGAIHDGPGDGASDGSDAAMQGQDSGRTPVGDADTDGSPGIVVDGLDDRLVLIANGAADRCATVAGHDLCGGSCNGTCAGSTALSTYAVQTGNAAPSTDGASARVDVAGAGTDTLEWVKVDPAATGKGVYASMTRFRWSLDFYPTAITRVQAYEFDLFFGSNGWWLMMGTQCDLSSGNWNGWNEATGHWIPSAVSGCGSFFHVGAWNHVVLSFHRDPGPTGATTRYYYDGLEVNGMSHTWGLAGFTGSDKQWGDVVGVQVQQDLTGSYSGTLTSYYDGFTLEMAP